MSTEEESKPGVTYDAGCHCGYISLSITLRPGLDEYKVLNCSCSMCQRAGYLLTYAPFKDVTWHNDSRDKCSVYRFNTKKKQQLFCPKCGASIGIDFSGFGKDIYGISARSFNNIDLDTLKYEKLDGINKVEPAGDLSGKGGQEV